MAASLGDFLVCLIVTAAWAARAFSTFGTHVAAVLPALGSCAEAGYEARFPMLPGDDGTHDLHVVFRSADGRMRTISRAFEWAP